MLIALVIIFSIVVCISIISFLVLIIYFLKQNHSLTDQVIYTNIEWADKYKETIQYYEKEITGLLEEMYGNEEELKN